MRSRISAAGAAEYDLRPIHAFIIVLRVDYVVKIFFFRKFVTSPRGRLVDSILRKARAFGPGFFGVRPVTLCKSLFR